MVFRKQFSRSRFWALTLKRTLVQDNYSRRTRLVPRSTYKTRLVIHSTRLTTRNTRSTHFSTRSARLSIRFSTRSTRLSTRSTCLSTRSSVLTIISCHWFPFILPENIEESLVF